MNTKLHVDALLLSIATSTDNFTVGFTIGLSSVSSYNYSNLQQKQKQKRVNEQRSTTHNNFWLTNIIISICNAFGAFIASFGGSYLGTTFPLIAPILASISFGYLSIQEFYTYYYCEDENTTNNTNHQQCDGGCDKDKNNKTNKNSSSKNTLIDYTVLKDIIKLAIPMTLNNLAGGVAGGAVGLTPFLLSLYALLASLITMFVGYLLGKYIIGKHLVANNKNNSSNNNSNNAFAIHPTLLSAILLLTLCVVTLYDCI